MLVVLVKVLSIKLKKILQSKIFVISAIIITILYVSIKIKVIEYKQEKLNDNYVQGIIKNIDDGSLIVDDTIIYTDTSKYILGNKVKCEGIISLPPTNTNFNLFNYQKYLASQKIYYVMKGECQQLKSDVPVIYKIKNYLINRAEKLKSSRYIKAFILGITDDIDDDTYENYRINGINHLFSISGMHISFIISLLSFFSYKIIIVFILLFYLILLGFPASMTRAVIFYIFMLINKRTLKLERIYLFIILIILMLLYNPYYIYNVGFVYSYVITFFLILYSDCLFEKKYFKSLLKTSLIIFIITIPINIQNNFYLNFITPILNMLFIPYVSLILFPLSFITFIFPIFDSGFNLLCIILEKISNFLALNFSLIHPFSKLNLIMFIGYYVIIVFIMHKIRNKEYKYIGLIFICIIIHSLYPYIKDKGMVLMLDVGQGDSILVTYPHNKLNILIDTGGYYDSNIIKNVTIPTLYSLGIKELDYLILTHGDYDHVGETINLLKQYKVKKVLLNASKINDLENNIVSYLERNSIPYAFISNEIIENNNIKLYFLNKGTSDNENDDSLVIYLNINKYKVLLMGDASKNIENNLLLEYNLSNVDILKVGHHGSNTSSGKDFIEEVRPKISLISAGKNNMYGHPHQEVLTNLQLSDTYVTSIDGAIKILLGDSILVQTVR